MNKGYACDELQERKIYKKINRTENTFQDYLKYLKEAIAEEDNKELALTYRALTKGNNGINGRIVTPLLYLVRNDKDVTVTMGTTKGKNIHHRSPILRKNDQFLKGYRRIQYDNLSNTVINILEQLLPDAVKPHTHNDVLMTVSYLFNLSGKVPFSKIEKDNYDTGNDQEYIDNAIELAREHFTARDNQKWFSFSLPAMCSEMICDPVIVNDVLMELEAQRLLIHDQISYPEVLSRGKIKEHVLDIVHLNFEIDNAKREEYFLQLEDEIRLNKHIPSEFKDKKVDDIFVTDAQIDNMVEDIAKNFNPNEYDNVIQAKIKMATENGSTNVIRKSMSQIPELEGDTSEYAKKADAGLDNVIRSINAQMEQMKIASVGYVEQLARAIEKLQKRNTALENENVHLQAQLQSKTARLEKIEGCLQNERDEHKAEIKKLNERIESLKAACASNVENVKTKVDTIEKKYKDAKKEIEATDRFLQDYIAESQKELLDAQMFILAQMDSFSQAKHYQLNDKKFINKFRINIGDRINKLVQTFANYKSDDRVPNAMN